MNATSSPGESDRQELELSQARLSELLRHAPAYFAVLRGPAHRVEHVNEQWLQLVGLRDTEGLPIAQALPEWVSQGLVNLLDEVYRSGQAYVGREVRMLLQTQTAEALREHILDLVFQPLVERHGRTLGILIHGIDQTERKRAEQELQSARERVELATEAAGMGVWRWEFPDGRSHWEDDRARKIFGLEADSGAQQQDRRLTDFVHPDDATELQTRLSQAQAGQGKLHFIGRIRRHDDLAVRWVEMIGRHQPASAGTPACVLGTVADITHRQQARAQTRADEEKYRRLVESMDEGFCVLQMIFDVSGRAQDYRFIDVNEAFAKHTGLVDALGRRALELVPGLERHWLDIYGQVARSGKPQRFTQQSPVMGRWFNVYAAPAGEAGSGQVALLVTDVTEQKVSELKLKQLAAELSAAHQHKDRFLATLAHELRNPLAPLRNGLLLMRSGAGDAALVNVACEMMDRQLTQLTSLVSDLLDVARSHSGKLEIQRERVLLEPMVRTAVETNLPQIEAAGHHFKLRLPRLPVWLDADPFRFVQLLNNLLDNAAKYTPPRGTIELAAEVDGVDLVLCVTDNGAGLTPAMIDTVFEMFSQGHSAKTQAPGGLGIGLSLVRDLVKLHGGSVSAHSDGLGAGSVFTVRLPLPSSDLGGGTSSIASRPSTTRPPDVPWRVLVADDNRDAGESLALLLQLSGHVTAWARDGVEAVALVDSFKPELVVLDIGMPGLSGHEVAKKLRQDPKHQGLVLVALTGWGADEDRLQSSVAGFDLHLTKPADPATLLNLMQTISRQRGGDRA